MEGISDLIEKLEKRINFFKKYPERDNEATRHDQLIIPFILGGLGWNADDLLSQNNIKIPIESKESHVFRNANRKKAIPDLIVSPLNYKNVVVIEEKKRQNSIEDLNEYRMQLTEYQSLYSCVWGILTDGEIWIIKRNFEIYIEVKSTKDLKKQFKKINNCIGKKALMERLNKYGEADIVEIPGEKLNREILLSPKLPIGYVIFSLGHFFQGEITKFSVIKNDHICSIDSNGNLRLEKSRNIGFTVKVLVELLNRKSNLVYELKVQIDRKNNYKVQ